MLKTAEENSPNTQEVTDLMGVEYNSYWGYQNGKRETQETKMLKSQSLC